MADTAAAQEGGRSGAAAQPPAAPDRAAGGPGPVAIVPTAADSTAAAAAAPADPPPPVATPPGAQAPAAPRPGRRRRRGVRPHRARVPILFILAMFGALALVAMAAGTVGKPVRLPVWAVAEAEARLNAMLAQAVAGSGAAGAEGGSASAAPVLSLGSARLTVARDLSLRLDVGDLRLMRPGGGTLAVLPQVQIGLAVPPDGDAGADGAWLPALRLADLRVTDLRVTGARLVMRRLEDGRLDVALGAGLTGLNVDGLGDLFDTVEAVLALPALSALTQVEADALTLTVEDRLAGRTWEVGDGRLRLDNRATEVAAQAGLTLIGGGQQAARLDLTAVSDKAGGAARMVLTADRAAAADLAALAPPLSFLAVLDAPLSGRIEADLGPDGRLSRMAGGLDIGAGVLAGGADAAPVRFDHAALTLAYDPARARIDLTAVEVQSPSLQLRAHGHAYLAEPAAGGVPAEILIQVALDEARVDPEGLFVAPAVFSGGAADLRLRPAPLRIDIGQVQLLDGARRLSLAGSVAAEPGGWRVALDLGVDAIASERLLALWPLALVPRTREWLAANVQEGVLSNLRGAVRMEPGREALVSLTYDYTGADVRFMRTLPPIEGGAGYAALQGTRYTLVLDRGRVVPPEGGALDMAGSVFAVPDITRRPTVADVVLRSRGSLTATLSLIDQPPFGFLGKAGQPVNLGEGEAVVEARLRLPLVDRVAFADVDWRVAGTVRDFASGVLVPGRQVRAPSLAVTADPSEVRVAGKGTLDGVPFDAVWRQPLGPGSAGAQLTGTVEISASAVERLRLGLPRGMVGGLGQGRVEVDLTRGRPAVLRLTSDLRGVSLGLPEIGWQKARAASGRLEATARLGARAAIDRLVLTAPGLSAEGRIDLRPGGGLDRARLSRVRAGAWFDGPVTLVGRGAAVPAVEVAGGTLDLRSLPEGIGGGRGGAGGGAITVQLDRVRVTEGIALTGLRGSFRTAGGFAGEFLARVNGQAVVQGRVSPDTRGGSAVRLTSDDGGGVLAASGLFPNARGGRMELVLRPRGTGWDGRMDLGAFRLRNTPVLAELLNAVSVVGLLEQLNGQGLFFQDGQADFRLTPRGAEITRASAVGASMGISLSGVYDAGNGRLDLRGVISPIYLVNAVGAVLTRRGEGLFGFNYTVRGTVENPQIGVNPLSILTPGMFRELFRRPPPRIGGAAEPDTGGAAASPAGPAAAPDEPAVAAPPQGRRTTVETTEDRR